MTDRVSRPSPDVVVLVEGRSDAVVVERLLSAHGLRGVRVEVMDGVTNVERALSALEPQDLGRAAGLFDATESRFVQRALARRSVPVEGPEALPRAGFFACEADLEDELIRSLGTAAVMAAIAELGELARFRTFQNQPEWRGRPLDAQLRRFAGAGSGRKERLAAALAARLTPDTTPPPLAALLRHLTSLTRG